MFRVKGYEVMLLEINDGADYCETLRTIGEENLLISSTSSSCMQIQTDETNIGVLPNGHILQN